MHKIMRMMHAVADKIRKIRMEKGYSQEYVAMQMDVEQSTVARWEKGETAMKMKDMFKIAEVLEVDVVELIKPNQVVNIMQDNQMANGIVENLYAETTKKQPINSLLF